MAVKLTVRQQEIFEFIQEFIQLNDYPPTQQEVAAQFGFSINSARDHIMTLDRKGYVQVTSGLQRGIKLVA